MSKKQSLRERMEQEKEDLKNKNFGNIVFQKPDKTIRVRILNMGEEQEFIKEITHFYLGSDIKGVISPDTFGEPCGIMEGYEELKESKEDEDNELAAGFSPRKKYLAWCAIAKDLRGEEWEDEPKLVLIPSSGQYGEILDLYLDDEEWGDMTHPKKGYDLKLGREGKGKKDTTYSASPCKNTKAPKAFRNEVYDLDEEVRKEIPTYDESKRFLERYLGISSKEEKKKKKKKKKKKDLDDDDLPF